MMKQKRRKPLEFTDPAAEARHLRAVRAARARWYPNCTGMGAMSKDLQARVERGEDPLGEIANRLRREGKLPCDKSTLSQGGDLR